MNAIMISAFVFIVFLTVVTVSVSAPVNNDDVANDNVIETPTLLDDLVIPDVSSKNADPCTAKGCMWPKLKGIVYVPYVIDRIYTRKERDFIVASLQEFHRVTCIRFIPKEKNLNDYIHFFSGTGCYSYLGRQRGKQNISLERSGCLSRTTIQHEILHALGFNHEQVRSDRDKYVVIHKENIKDGKEHNFIKKETNNLATPYDFMSIMEYPNNAFSKNGKDTIVAKKNPNMKFGHAKKMSNNDIIRINRLYKCQKLRSD